MKRRALYAINEGIFQLAVRLQSRKTSTGARQVKINETCMYVCIQADIPYRENHTHTQALTPIPSPSLCP